MTSKDNPFRPGGPLRKSGTPMTRAEVDAAIERTLQEDQEDMRTPFSTDEPTNPVADLTRAMGKLQEAAESVRAVMGSVPDEDTGAGMDEARQLAAMSKVAREVASEVYSLARQALWEAVGQECGNFTTPSGATVKFKRMGRVKRSTRFKVLEEKYPAIYEEVVTQTPVDLTQPGNLYL